MQLHQDKLGTIKTYIHAAQAALLFLAWVLTIAVFTRNGATDGRTGWYFGLCWLTIPILIYLVMVPMWSRAQRFSNVYAFAFLDGLAVVLWLSGWAAVASYVVSGKGKAKNDKATGCENFSLGSAGKCKLSEGTIVLGVLIMLLFCATAFISFRAVMHYKRTGMMPNQSVSGIGGGGLGGAKPVSSLDHDGAFDSRINGNEFDEDEQHGRTSYHGASGNYGYQKPAMEDEYVPVQQGDHDYDDAHTNPTLPGGPLSSSTRVNGSGLPVHTGEGYDSGYTGSYAQHQQSGGYNNYGVR